MSILRIRDADGNVVEILAIRGEKGKPFVYEDFTDEQIDDLTQKIARTVMDTANICYVSTVAPTSDLGKDGDICVVSG